MKTFKSLLEELDIVLQKYNPVEYKKLQNPLPDEEIEKRLLELGIKDESLKEWFQWKNGEKEDSNCQMMNLGGMLSLESIKKDKRSNLCEYFDEFLVPLISDNGEEMLLFNSKPGLHYGKLYYYSVPYLYIDYPISYYDSLEAMIRTIIESYKTKAYNYDFDENWLDMNYSKFRKIAKKNNKESKYWTEHDSLQWEEWYEI